MLARQILFATTCVALAVASVRRGAATPEMLCDNAYGCDIRLPHNLMQGSSLVGVLQEFEDRLDALRRDVDRLYFAPGINIHDIAEQAEEASILREREAASPRPKPSPPDTSGARSISDADSLIALIVER